MDFPINRLVVVPRKGNREVKLMMISECESCIIKLWDNESYDVDEDGNKYHRGLIIRNCGSDEPMRVKCEYYDKFVKTQIDENEFKILHIR
tara:strand:- start:827 stop:1099 length:273 start_codon:yes stop_codon:yes gene_type:complete